MTLLTPVVMYPDPYRDLAYQVKSLDGFVAVSVLYQEFYWAEYFRRYIPFPKRHPMVWTELPTNNAS